MKKLSLFLVFILLLTACAAPAEPVVTTEAPVTEVTAAQTELPTEAPTEEETETVTEAPTVLDIALTFVDHSVEELKAVLGEPDDALYEDSCSGDGDDGFLYYGDVTVYTYREADGSAETVVDAERND